MGGLRAEQFAIKHRLILRQIFGVTPKNLKTQNFKILIANYSAHRPPTEMSLYFLESSGQGLSIDYFGGLSVSRAICVQTSPDFATDFRETPNFRGVARG